MLHCVVKVHETLLRYFTLSNIINQILTNSLAEAQQSSSSRAIKDLSQQRSIGIESIIYLPWRIALAQMIRGRDDPDVSF